MKKLFVSVFCLVAIASFGGIIASAHAQTASLTPAEAAALQQELSTLKAKLLELQAQAAAQQSAQPAGSGGVMSSPAAQGSSLTLTGPVLSAQDVASLSSALTLLATALQNLQAQFAANPSLATGHETAVLATLQGIGLTLSSIGNAITNAPVAAAAPAPAAATPSPVAQSSPSAAPSKGTAASPTPEGSLATPSANATPEIAQMGTTFSLNNLNWPLIVVIILILAAIASWLFWPGEGDATRRMARARTPAPPSAAPPAPVKQMPMMPHTAKSTTQAEPRQTPLASAVAAPAEKPGASAQNRSASASHTAPAQPQQQRKPA
jgi:hypothetical protein